MNSADRYEEMLKRLRIEQVKPQMVADSSQYVQDQPEMIDTTPQEATPVQIEDQYRRPSQDRDINTAIGDMAVATGPALQNILFGGSYAEQTGRTKQAADYLASRGKTEAADRANLKTIVGAEGKPEYLRASLAEGREPYIAPKAGLRTAADLAGHVHSAQKVFNMDTKERGLKILYKNGTSKIINSAGEESTGGKWEPDVGVGVITTEDPYGGKRTEQWNKNVPTGGKKTITQQPGYGTMVKVPTEGLKQAEKSLDEHNKRIGDIELKRNDLQSSLEIMSKPDATPTELTAARESLIRSISTEPRLTDEDVARAMGNDFRSIFAQTRNAIKNKAFGEMSPEQRKEFIQSAKTLIKKMNQGIDKSYNKMLEESGTVPGGKDYLEKKTPSQTKKTKEKQAEYIKIQSQAKKAFGNDIDSYNRYMSKKKYDMGLE